MTNVQNEMDKNDAVEILRGKRLPPDELLELAKRLARNNRFGYARMLLKRARVGLKRTEFPEIYLEIFKKSALYTYKDPDLPADWRLNRALEILGTPEDLLTTRDQETLGIAGAIYKRKWEVDRHRHNLERSLLYYLKGYAEGGPTDDARTDILKFLEENPGIALQADGDRGYDGINAAFTLDLLAQQEEEEAANANGVSESAKRRREDARRIREEITRSVPPLIERPEYYWLKNEWWFYATVGEAFFGLDQDEAREWLVSKPAEAGLKVPEWQYESTARQLVRLALSKDSSHISADAFAASWAGRLLRDVLRGDETAVRSAFRGKIGLALSGGGFRASLYHIGLLAKLAECDLLRHVEVLSCVSGGSIVGAYYYLELRRLLQTKTDDAITGEDYVAIVRRIEEQFLEGVQRNIRTRVLAELSTNLKLLFWPAYSRTLRVGELYERELFSRVPDGEGRVEGPRWLPDWLARTLGFRREPRWLNGLCIHPLDRDGRGPDADFDPRSRNWRRKNKVPILVLNATSLNTGHLWQFTASYMGEPPMSIEGAVDSKYRLRRMYYKDAPERFRNVRLGHAVAASSCVPALFEPLILDGLYPERRVRLVDGGVCDNQGVASLLEQDCTVLLVSDGSGQMDAHDSPSGSAPGVLWRSYDISMARVREAQYRDLSARRRSLLLRGLMLVHLKRDLVGEGLAWNDCPAHREVSDFDSEANIPSDTMRYSLASDIQERLAAIRTDLDSFSDAEAYALMASAYYMTGDGLGRDDRCFRRFSAAPGTEGWKFLAIESSLSGDSARKKHLEKLLRVSGSRAFRLWKQFRPPTVVRQVGIAAVLAFIGFALYSFEGASMMILRTLRFLASSIVLVFVVGWLLVRAHLHFFDRLYLRQGKLDRFPKD